jgi:hypothetical protein
VGISDALTFDIQGGVPDCSDLRGQGSEHSIYTSVAADAGKYAGMVPLADAASLGDYSVKASGIFGQLVPSAQVESPITDAEPHVGTGLAVSTQAAITKTTTADWDATHTLYVGQGVYPGSLRVTIGGTEVVDEGDGTLTVADIQVGTIDYANGVLSIVSGGPDYGTASKTINFIGAAFPVRNAQAAAWDVLAETRSGTYVFVLNPIPAPGSLRIDYMAQGRWYSLQDDGAGLLRGADTSYGSGTVNFVSGSVIVTLGALPDVGSSVIAVWGTELVEIDRKGATIAASFAFNIDKGTDALEPGGIAIEWTDGGMVNYSAIDDGAGNLTGDATGTVNYATGAVRFVPDLLPPGGAELSVTAGYGPAETGISSIVGNVITLSALPVAGSVRLAIPNDTQNVVIILVDDGAGNLLPTCETKKVVAPSTPVGTVNYGTGVATITGTVFVYLEQRTMVYSIAGMLQSASFVSAFGNKNWESVALTLAYADATAEYRSGAAAGTLPVQTFTWAASVDLTQGYAETIVGGSVRLTFGGDTLIDRDTGRLEKNIDISTGAGTQVATLSYASGAASLTAYTPGASNSGTIDSMLTTLGGLAAGEVVFRTASAPIRSGSLILQFQYADGEGVTVTVTADTNGVLSAADVEGTIEVSMGIARVRFGRWVQVTPEIEAQPWYNPLAVVIENIGGVDVPFAFQPKPVLVDTVRYACVTYSYIPLDADILGINPVKLPTDGRVPIFRTGDVVVLHHTDSETVTPSNGLVVDLGRVRLSRVWLFDEGDADARVATTKYTADLDAGTVTFTDISGLVGPIRIEHRIEDMALASDVQINGQLTFTRPITHDYPALTTGVSSALVIGDMQARATRPFDQQTWSGVWSDSLIGNATLAEYNDTLYPLLVTNIGAIDERWLIQFINTTNVNVIGESIGQILSNVPIASDIAPMNPVTLRPYFTIDAAGWGAGWAAGNCLRFNTISATYPVWLARTIQQGPASGDSDGFRIQIRGDANA